MYFFVFFVELYQNGAQSATYVAMSLYCNVLNLPYGCYKWNSKIRTEISFWLIL